MALGSVSPTRFPRAAAYLAGLPQGLESFPGCRCRAEVNREILRAFPDVLDRDVDHALATQLRGWVSSQEWMPDAAGVLLRLMLRDAYLTDDASFMRWNFDVSAKVFSTPTYRVLMYVLSPTLVLMGAARRWGTFRQGSTLAAEGGKEAATLTLTFPALLYPEVVCRAFGESFRAALAAAKAQGIEVELRSFKPGEAVYATRWHG